MIFLWLLKIKSVITSVITFIAEHWQVFAVLAMALAIFHYKTAYEREKHAFEVHLLADAKAYEVRQAENKVKEERHAKDVAAAHAETVALIEKFKLDRERYTKEIKDLYANKTNSEFRLNSYADWLRLERERKTTSGMPDTESDTSALAEGWRNCDAAYTTLEQACRLTTLDYNELRLWGDSVCQTIECK